jgi:hypothetical protein
MPVRDAVRGERLILAAKAAGAASLAWLLAPYVPYADAEYSYYAPLGVLVSMYPTVAGSARVGAQSLAGLGIGIALGLGMLGLVFVGLPAVIAVALVIGAGILISGIRALGAGGDWVGIAALFVLLLGGPDADGFSLSYLLTMAFGVLVGLLTNVLIVPPLYLRRASERLTALRDAVCSGLRDVADALDRGAIDPDWLSDAGTRLAGMLDDVSGEVRFAEESSRANPRGRRRRDERRLNERRMAALERSTAAATELADLLARGSAEHLFADGRTRSGLAAAVRASADLVESPAADPRAQGRLASAVRTLDDALAQLARRGTETVDPPHAQAYAYAAALCVRRIVDASRDFIAATA